MANESAYDVIVIGSGAGGGTLVHNLAPSGKRILLLERGDYVREKENWDPTAVKLNGRYQTTEVWKDVRGRDLHPHTNYAVGGNTKFYGAALFRLRKEDVGERIPLAGVAHQNGTIRFGSDPATSALDRNCKAHDVDNLYVVDASFFPSSGAVNPALTIMANALRVGDHLRQRLG
jgi:choline dehydrogenase-like flavoprotein